DPAVPEHDRLSTPPAWCPPPKRHRVERSAPRMDHALYRADGRCAGDVARADPVQRVPRGLRLCHRHPRLRGRRVDGRAEDGRLPRHGRLAPGLLRCRTPDLPGPMAARRLPPNLWEQRHLWGDHRTVGPRVPEKHRVWGPPRWEGPGCAASPRKIAPAGWAPTRYRRRTG